MTSTQWSTASHDVIPPLEFDLLLTEVPTYLHGLLRSEHEEFREPYAAVRQNIQTVINENSVRSRAAAQPPRSDVAPSRLRTWKKVFEEFGLLYVSDDQRLRTTALGSRVRDLHSDLADKVAGANAHIASLGLAVLGRHTLRSPLTTASYPPETDLHPYRAIWATVRALDDRVHWEELNRVLMHLTQDADLRAAIDHIRATRPASGSYTEAALGRLGTPAVDDGAETRRRITPWLIKAGLGGTILAEAADGFYTLRPEYRTLIDALLSEPAPTPTPQQLLSREAYLAYLIAGLAASDAPETLEDEPVLDRLEAICQRYGSRKIIALSGIPGTGKTRLARMLASRITQNDTYRIQEIQFHERTGYEQFVEGFVPRTDGTGFELKPMTLREINDRARQDPGGRPYVLLIEELTRADVHAALGELLTYIEHRDRSFRLPLSQLDMKLAPNLVVIATMNPRDKSALRLDQAILRRLHQISVAPSPAILQPIAARNLTAEVAVKLLAWYANYAAVLPFGHGEFTQATSEEELGELWHGTLVHTLTDVSGQIRGEFVDAASTYPWA
ncbi:AAA family ATPase [Nocardioides sp. zg-1230]|uniref:AAA family ATPase n=1 Tax=Nocardioides sp. zg-1230 TaxID=2736601 RepID=UPI001556F33B|nr:AAA family ATPase [Nocardioides sp. zg-1230]NPC41055.1 AAA domain-containing protein [Nocardioides sp. zg-1230]